MHAKSPFVSIARRKANWKYFMRAKLNNHAINSIVNEALGCRVPDDDGSHSEGSPYIFEIADFGDTPKKWEGREYH
jgi:hypothetical protein